MLNFGWPEITLIAVLALVVIGPRELPSIMRSVGRYMRRARGFLREIQDQMEDTVGEDAETLREEVRTPKRVAERVLDPEGRLPSTGERDHRASHPTRAEEMEARPEPPLGGDTDEVAYGSSGGGWADTRGSMDGSG